MGLFDKAKRTVNRVIRSDFMDLDSLGITPQTFGQTGPQYVPITDENLSRYESLYKRNGLAHKIIAKPAEDATRNGWRIVIPGDPDRQNKYQKALDGLNLKREIANEIIYQRLFGDGYLTVGTSGELTNDTSDPIELDNLQSIAFIHSFGRKHVRKSQINADPTSKDYGQESAIVLDIAQNGETIDKYGNATPNKQDLKPIVLDSSRYKHIYLDKLEDDNNGVSFLERCMDSLKAMDTGLLSTGRMLFEYTLKVFKSEEIAEADKKELQKFYDNLSQGFSTESFFVIGQDEEVTKLGTNVSGIKDLFDFAWQNISAASNIPKSVLTGEQSGTLAGASQDIANYYDNIKAIQEEYIKPQLEWIVRLLMHSSDVADGKDDPDKLEWHIEFNPLWSADDKTQSETLLNYANAASTLVSAGIKDPEQAGLMLAGQDNNQVSGMQTKTDADDLTADDIESYKKQLEEFNHGS